MGKLETINKIISDMEKLRLQVKHEVEASSKVYNKIYEHGKKLIWEEYGRGRWYTTPVTIYDGVPESYEDWYAYNYKEFPSFLSSDDFEEVFATELADKYREECEKAYEQSES